MQPVPTDVTDDRPDTVSVRDATYLELKARLVRGEFVAGERLGEKRLAADMGVSRTPIREALGRLHSEGYVQRYHNGGGYVPVIPDLQSIHELYDIRFALERWALNRPLHGGAPHDGQQLLALRDEWSSMETPAHDESIDPSIVDRDEEFHLRLAAASGNRELVDQLRAINARIRPVRAHDFLRVERVSDAIDEHLHILDPLLNGDLAEADRRLARHFAVTRDLVERQAALAIAAMVQRPRR